MSKTLEDVHRPVAYVVATVRIPIYKSDIGGTDHDWSGLDFVARAPWLHRPWNPDSGSVYGCELVGTPRVETADR